MLLIKSVSMALTTLTLRASASAHSKTLEKNAASKSRSKYHGQGGVSPTLLLLPQSLLLTSGQSVIRINDDASVQCSPLLNCLLCKLHSHHYTLNRCRQAMQAVLSIALGLRHGIAAGS
eukprot:scpid78772/ scgid20854/ 